MRRNVVSTFSNFRKSIAIRYSTVPELPVDTAAAVRLSLLSARKIPGAEIFPGVLRESHHGASAVFVTFTKKQGDVAAAVQDEKAVYSVAVRSLDV